MGTSSCLRSMRLSPRIPEGTLSVPFPRPSPFLSSLSESMVSPSFQCRQEVYLWPHAHCCPLTAVRVPVQSQVLLHSLCNLSHWDFLCYLTVPVPARFCPLARIRLLLPIQSPTSVSPLSLTSACRLRLGSSKPFPGSQGAINESPVLTGVWTLRSLAFAKPMFPQHCLPSPYQGPCGLPNAISQEHFLNSRSSLRLPPSYQETSSSHLCLSKACPSLKANTRAVFPRKYPLPAARSGLSCPFVPQTTGHNS